MQGLHNEAETTPCLIVGTSPPAPLPERLLPLLEAIAHTGSLAHAVAHCDMSYRSGWGLLRECRELLGVDLVHLARGKGGGLAPAGEGLIEAAAAATHRLARIAPTLTIDLGGGPIAQPPAPGLRLRMAASHDLALAALRDALATRVLALELRFVGVWWHSRNSRAAVRMPRVSRTVGRPRGRRRGGVLALSLTTARPANPLRRAGTGDHPGARQSGASAEFP
jgi:molybdate transport repressor ModE-like protein